MLRIRAVKLCISPETRKYLKSEYLNLFKIKIKNIIDCYSGTQMCSFAKQFETKKLMRVYLLKGCWHEIFCLWFTSNMSPNPLIHTLKSFWMWNWIGCDIRSQPHGIGLFLQATIDFSMNVIELRSIVSSYKHFSQNVYYRLSKNILTYPRVRAIRGGGGGGGGVGCPALLIFFKFVG